MEHKEQLEQVLGRHVNMALATCVDGQPNVRVVTFAYDPKKPGRLFFTTFKDCGKVEEMRKNPKVACMPLPLQAEEDVQVRIFGTVKESEVTMAEVVEIIARKYPEGSETIQQGGEMMRLYEVDFEEAFLTIGMEDAVAVRM